MAKVEKEKKEKSHFFKDFKAELKKVIWPAPKQVVNNTTAVVVIVLITALIVFVLDLTFETLNTHGVNRLKSIVRVEENVIDNNTIDNTTNAIDENQEQQEETNTVPEE
ncbi:MAG: preprotein translocase subunit SecE [Clostridia bacterium]|jgi:preprotein translocase subunit SecE|nr:preprotein translocase subunit SecE [Clostridia bacterium]